MTSSSPLAEFLRARREQLSPADVGLRSSARRRTPGLRREEVATLAGVSIDYLVRLEQGRDTNPSPSVISALAGALRLSEQERRHLALLAAHSSNADLCPGGHGADPAVPATVVTMLEHLDPTPAFVSGPYGDVLAWNPAWERVAAPMGFLDGERPNLVRFAFLDPSASDVHVDWQRAADEQVATLRAASMPFRDDDRYVALFAELHAVPEFERRWAAHKLATQRRSNFQVRHPDHGILTIDAEVLLLPDDFGQRLIVWLAADEATAAAFADPASTETVSPARLRVVGET